MITLRPKQAEILSYLQGKMGISAVPGSGKTFTLSLLAARLIAEGGLQDNQEVLVVTLVNSAVDNFASRIRTFLPQSERLLPRYRVCTLHSLAYDIVRERPGLVGLERDFQIIDERAAESIREEAAASWLRTHPMDLDDYLDPNLDESSRDRVRREWLPDLVQSIALSFIRTAKDLQLTPEALHLRLQALPAPLPLAEMGSELYSDYQRALNYRSAVDFDDLIRLALQALHNDPQYLERLRRRWPYILEDEAQDSSRLQEHILALLCGPGGNWVRVGDPNQAIYETFTTANPKYLRAFLQQPEVVQRTLPNSGRSTPSIISLANHLVEWTMNSHPLEEAREALSAPPWIEPTKPDDPQPNPPDNPTQIHLVTRRFTPQEEVLAVAESLARWLEQNPKGIVAVLAPRNKRAFDLVDELRRRRIAYDDSLLRSSSSTRFSAGALGNLLKYLGDPQSTSKLATVYRVWRRGDRDDEEAQGRTDRSADRIRKIGRVEDFIWPRQGQDWLLNSGLESSDPEAFVQLSAFRQLVQRWQAAILLPIDQVVLTLAQDLLKDPDELAVAHKLATLLRRASQANASWRLPELTEELAIIARNERRFLGFSQGDTGFNPEDYAGKVVVSTIHKAKGLEWQRIYLMSVNNYDFPSGQPADQYISERWFIRDHLNLEAEGLDQLEAVVSSDEYQWYSEGQATLQSRLDYIRERLRLLYVGITRARQELVITWNTGRLGNLLPAIPLAELQAFWQGKADQAL